jgi:hypothetical protein
LFVQLPLATAASTTLDNDETTTIPVQKTNQHIQEITDDARPPVLVTTSTLRFTTFDLPPDSIIWNEKSGSSGTSTSSGDGSSATTTTSSTHVTITHSKAIRDEPNSNLSLTLLPEQCHSRMCLKQTLRFVVLDVSSTSNVGTH